MRGWIGKGLGAALIVLAAVLLLTYEPPAPPEAPPPVRPAKTMLLESAAHASQRAYPGRVEAIDVVDVSFRVDGPLVEFPVRANDEVEKGDLLARIDARDFTVMRDQISSQLNEAKAQLAAMLVGARPEDIAILESNVKAAEARLRDLQLEFNREKDLLGKGASTQAQFDIALAKLDVGKEQVKAAQESLNKGKRGARKEDIDAQQARVRGLQASLRSAQNALDDTALLAPFSGKIARTYVDNFQDVRRKQAILSLQDVSRVKIVADIPEQVAALIKRENVKGFKARFDFLKDRAFDVELYEVEIESDRRTQTYAATFVMPAPKDVRILPGMTSTVLVELKEGASVAELWYVPADAIFVDEAGKSYLWKVDESSLTVGRKPVTVGDMRRDSIEIRSGVRSGDRIVVAGVRLLREGMKIRILAERSQ